MPSDISVTINPPNSTSVTIGGALYPHANTHLPNGSDPITGFASYEQLIQVSGLIGSPPDVVLLVGDQNISGTKNFYSRPTVGGIPVLISGEAGGAASTGDLANVFYPLNSNPNGYVTGQIVRPSETGAFLVTGAGDNRYILQSSSGQFASVSYVLNVSGDLQNQLNSLISETGDYALASQTGGFLSTGAADARYALQNKTGEYAGTFYPKNSNPSGYITGVDLSNYATLPYATGLSGYLDSQISSLENVTGSFALAANSGYWITGYNDSITGINVAGTSSKTITLYRRDGSTLSASFSDMEGTGGGGTDYFLTGASFNSADGNLSLYVNDGSVVVESLDGRYVTGNVVRPNETGSFIVSSQTGQFYPKSNPSGFITGVDLSAYQTIAASTGISGYLNSRITTIESLTGSFASTGYVTGVSGYLQNQISAISNGTGVFLATGAGDFRYVNVTGDTISGNLNVTGYTSGQSFVLTQNGYIDFQGGNPTHREGRVFYDTDAHTLCYYNDESDVTLNIGQEHLVRVSNGWTGDILNGMVCYASGSQGNRLKAFPASAGNSITPRPDVIGVATHDISSQGYITTIGLVNGLDTDEFNEGDTVYLSMESGKFSTVRPNPPNHSVRVGIITRAHQTQGQLFVNIDNGQHLNYLHDVNVTGVQNGDYLRYNSLSGYWENSVLATGAFLTTGAADSRYYPLSSNPSNYLVLADMTAFTGQAFSGYSNLITGISFTGTDTKTLTLHQQDGGTLSANFSDLQGTGGSASNVVYLTGSQNISGVKNFISRPTVNGTFVSVNGDPSVSEVYIDAGAMTTGISGAVATGIYLGGADISFDSYVFDAAADKYSQFKFSLPENLETGSLRAKFKWTAANGGTGHVRWGIQARSASNDDAISGSWGSAAEVVDQFITGYDCHITSGTSQISTANTLYGGDMIYFRAYRKASDSTDTLAVNAFLQGVSVQYSTTGSSASW